MNVRRMPSAPPNSPASNTTLSRGDAWPAWDASVVVQSSWANTNAAKSTSWESSTSRSRVDRPGLNVVRSEERRVGNGVIYRRRQESSKLHLLISKQLI